MTELEARVGRPTTRPVSQLGPIAKGDLLHVGIMDIVGPGVLSTRDARVGEDGKIGIPLVRLAVAGLTLPDAERAIEHAYRDANLIQNAQVQVERWEAAATSSMPTGPLRPGEYVRVVLTDLRGPGIETTINTQLDEHGNVDVPIIHLVPVAGMSEAVAGERISKAYRDANLIENMGATVLRTRAAEGL